MKLRTLFVAAALATVASLPASAATAGKPAKPNILWLIAEDFGQHLGCYGTKQVWTPNLDRLASEGVRYTHTYLQPVCSVSRSEFMTGMYSTTIGAHNHRTANKQPLPDGVRPLTHWLQDAGYYTSNLVELPESFGFRGAGKTDWNFKYEGKPFEGSRWADLPSHQPFYAQINFHETHRTNSAPKRADPAKVEIPPYYPDHPITRQDWAEYLDAATELDRKIGLIQEQLQREGLADNTIIVFFGDNGQSHVRGKQFCYEDGLLVPLIVRWPKNFPAPARFKAGNVDNRFIRGIDFAPTMLAIAGAPKPPKMQGRDFIVQNAEPDPQYIFGHRDRCDMTVMHLRSVRDTRYRYIHNFMPWVPFLAYNEYKQKQYPVWSLLPKLNAEGKLTPAQAALCQPTMPEEEFYDLQTDPFEINNLAKSTNPTHQAELKKLRGVLNKWMEETDDHGRREETLAELTENPASRFVPARDWRPQPGTPDAAKAEALRAAAKNNPPAAEDTPPAKKKRKKAE